MTAHMPGVDDIQADLLSRGGHLPNDWMLNREVFQKVCTVVPVPFEIDLCVLVNDSQLP